MKNYKRSAFALSVLIVLLVAGCQKHGQTPKELVNAKRPLVLLSVSEQGVVILDAEDKIYAYDENYFFAQNIIAGNLKAGDKLGN